jgi:hypothetical protein
MTLYSGLVNGPGLSLAVTLDAPDPVRRRCRNDSKVPLMRLFLAATLDLSEEREAARRVVDRLNEANSAQAGDELFVEIVDWDECAIPVVNLPEAVAFRNLPVDPNDLFIGASWLRFDKVEDRVGDRAICTERDFELAYAYWKTLRAPNCVFFRCMRLPRSLADIDSREFDRIGLFYKRFDSPEKNRFSFSEFAAVADFEQRVEQELSTVLGRLQAARAAARPSLAERAQLRGNTQFEAKMEPGKAYEVSFLSVEIVRWTELEQRYGSHPEALVKLSTAFRDSVLGISQTAGGEIFSWSPKGGVVMFWAKRSYDHAIMSGLKVMHSLPVFNLDPQQNPLGEPIEVRAAAHDAVIVFQLPIDQISSADIQFVLDLQAKGTDPGELSIARRLLERIDDRLKPHFKFKGRYEREPIYSCKLPTVQREGGQRPDINELVDRLKRQTSLILGLLQGPGSGLDVAAVESISTAIDETYSVLNRFCLAFSNLDPNWPREFIVELLQAVAGLRREEAAVWSRLKECSVDTKVSATLAQRLEAMVQAAARRRSRPVVILEKLEGRCTSILRTGSEPARQIDIGEEFLKAADRLIKADDLDNETSLTELLLHHKNVLLEYLLLRPDEERHRKLVQKLWETADLILLDDLYSLREHRRADERSAFDVLVHAKVGDGRFRIVREMLGSQTRPEEVVLGQLFARLGLKPMPVDLQVIWRCLVLGHGAEDVRVFSAMKLTSHSMWQVVSLPNIPIHSIYAIGDRMAKVEGEDARKIFFDCTRSRIDQAADSFRTRDDFDAITKLILLLLGFNFLAETGYFERFDDILRKYLATAQARGLRVDYFENVRRTLEEARLKAGEAGPSKPPAGIKNLPLTLQRRLAGEARYIYWFVTHPDPRIACETLRHIGLLHVERVLRLREVNGTVLQALLRRPELFTRSQALIAALNHPKCSQEFANKYIMSLVRSRQGREALDQIAQNASANPVVRASAKRAMAGAARLNPGGGARPSV